MHSARKSFEFETKLVDLCLVEKCIDPYYKYFTFISVIVILILNLRAAMTNNYQLYIHVYALEFQ